MRIVGGRFKGMRLATPKSRSVRPTTDRARESLFNILQHGLDLSFDGLRVMDLFAGTGALGLEALSRGAGFALFVDTQVEARALIRQNVERTATGGASRILRRDATSLGPAGTVPACNICFLDPPYGKGLAERALVSASDGGWLADDALCVVEEEARSDVDVPDRFELLDRRKVGDTCLYFLRHTDPRSGPKSTG